MKYIGAHVSIAGGVENAPLNAQAIGATAFAMFTKNQRQWSAPPYTRESVAEFRRNCRELGFAPAQILPHDGYLINLGQPDPDKRRAAREAFADEMRRCHQLGLAKLNFHPGSHLNKISEDACLSLIAESVRIAIDEVPEVVAVIENTAGQGSNLGYSFEQLGELVSRIDRPGRVGVCLDTCHTFAAGYDLLGDGFDRTMDKFAQSVGFELLAGMHLNDAKAPCGSRLDRHESLGKGTLGWPVFERIMKDPRFDGIPLVLETVDADLWPEEIARLKQAASACHIKNADTRRD